MTIKIVLPEKYGIKSGCGTKVFTESGAEIENITNIEILISPNAIIEARLTIAVSEVVGLDGIAAHASFSTIAELEKLGYTVERK